MNNAAGYFVPTLMRRLHGWSYHHASHVEHVLVNSGQQGSDLTMEGPALTPIAAAKPA